MLIGQTVKILPCTGYKYTSRERGGQEGEIKDFDPSDESYWVEFENNYGISTDGCWYCPDEFEVVSINPKITTVGQAIDFLVKAGYKVTIEKE